MATVYLFDLKRPSIMGSILTSKSIATTQPALYRISHVATLINSKIQSHTVHTQNDQKVIPAIHSSLVH